MNYSAMIQNRRSVHAFREKEVPSEAIGQLRSYYEKTCPRLVPEIATELIVLDKDAQPALESSAGYNQFLIGAPHYLLLMSAPHSYAAINAGYMMEDLVLKLTELDIDTCWMTFTDSDKIKKALSLATPLEGQYRDPMRHPNYRCRHPPAAPNRCCDPAQGSHRADG